MRDRRRVLLGFDFGGTKLALALAGANGRIEATRTLPTPTGQGAESALARALETAHDFLTAEHARACAVGVSTMGITHEDMSSWRRTCPAGNSFGCRNGCA